jgi:oligosaccharide repeat unit polymerase
MPHHVSNLWAIVATVLLAVLLVLDLRRGLYRIVSGRSVVLLAVFVWYLFEALRIPAELTRYSSAEYDFGILLLMLSVMIFLTTYHMFPVPLFAPLARRLPMLNQPRVLWLLVLGGMTIGIGSLLIYSGFDFSVLSQGLTGMRRRWTGERGRYGSWTSIIYELRMFLQATVPLAVALAFMKRAPTRQRWVAGTFVGWMFLRNFFGGTRSPLIPIALCLAGALFWNASPAGRRRLILVGMPLAIAAGYFWSAIIVAGRNDGKFDTSTAAKVDYVGFEMFRELLFVMRETEHGMPLQWGATYFTQLVNPIPRAIWPGKPVADAGLILARAYGAVDKNGEPTMTNSPGFLGEAWLNFGILGLLVVPAIAGVIVRAWDGLFPLASRSLPAFLIYAGGLATILASGRSFNFSNYYGLLALFFLMVAFEHLGLGTSSQRAARQQAILSGNVPVPARR